MNSNGERDEARIIAELNDLLQLDHDAVEGYTVAIDTVRDAGYRETLVAFRADHKRHIEELAALVRARGGLPTELPHPTGALKLAVQAAGAIVNDDALLLAFKAVEGQVRDKYRRFARAAYPPDIADVVTRAADDEEKHYSWTETTLRERGLATGTLPHSLASAVESIHKALADPIEAAGRAVMQGVGQIVGTTQTRGGSAAPSPADAAREAIDAPSYSSIDGSVNRADGTVRQGGMDPMDPLDAIKPIDDEMGYPDPSDPTHGQLQPRPPGGGDASNSGMPPPMHR